MIEFIKQYWLETLFTAIVSGLCLAVKKLYKMLKAERAKQKEREDAERKEQDLIKEGVLAMLHDRIYQSCQQYIQQEGITIADLDNLEYLYKGYRGLGGNGTGEVLYKRCKALPIIPTMQSEDSV